MVLIGTVLTHLFGGSAGREGTAVQMGASVADAIAHRFRVGRDLRRIVIAAGHRRRLRLGVRDTDRRSHLRSRGGLRRPHRVRRAHSGAGGGHRRRSGDARARHRAHRLPGRPHDPVFSRPRRQAGAHRRGDGAGDHRVHRIDPLHQGTDGAPGATPPLPDVRWAGSPSSPCGASSEAATTWASASRRSCVPFTIPTCPAYSFAAKIVFTAVTLGCGFLGGEVTPLFFIGATLGNVLARRGGDSDRAGRGGRPGGGLRRRRQHAPRALHHDGRARGWRDPPLRRHRDGHRVSALRPPRDLPGAAPAPEETWPGARKAGRASRIPGPRRRRSCSIAGLSGAGRMRRAPRAR